MLGHNWISLTGRICPALLAGGKQQHKAEGEAGGRENIKEGF